MTRPTPDTAPSPPWDRLAAARRVVVKLGTSVVINDDGLVALSRLYALMEAIAATHRRRRQIVLVSSGAIGLGMQALGLAHRPAKLADQQACAAIGQGRMMALYQDGFARLGITAAQVLLTEDDFAERRRYLALHATLGRLLALRAVPVINENDTVSTRELSATLEGVGWRRAVFGDNDRLSALVASKLGADALVILSDVAGLYTGNPATDSDAHLVPVVAKVTPDVERYASGGNARGRGGMLSKLAAAQIATNAGATTVIADGRVPGILDRLLTGHPAGTVFAPQQGTLRGKKRWLAWASQPDGQVVVNAGARQALFSGKASLLLQGIVRLEGSFEADDVVVIAGEDGCEIGRGVANCGRSEAEAALREGRHPSSKRRGAELITRDNIVLTIAVEEEAP